MRSDHRSPTRPKWSRKCARTETTRSGDPSAPPPTAFSTGVSFSKVRSSPRPPGRARLLQQPNPCRWLGWLFRRRHPRDDHQDVFGADLLRPVGAEAMRNRGRRRLLANDGGRLREADRGPSASARNLRQRVRIRRIRGVALGHARSFAHAGRMSSPWNFESEMQAAEPPNQERHTHGEERADEHRDGRGQQETRRRCGGRADNRRARSAPRATWRTFHTSRGGTARSNTSSLTSTSWTSSASIRRRATRCDASSRTVTCGRRQRREAPRPRRRRSPR